MSRRISTSIAPGFALLLASCAAQPPVAEVRLVASAYDQLSAASQPLLDHLALAEREQGKVVAFERAQASKDGSALEGDPCPLLPAQEEQRPDVPHVIRGFCSP